MEVRTLGHALEDDTRTPPPVSLDLFALWP